MSALLCSEALAVNQNNHSGEASILRCKTWGCEICAPINRWKVIKAAARGNPNKMLTLSCKHGKYETMDEAARDMKRGLDALRKRIARRWPSRKKIPLMVVFEAHKSGWPHMHILLRTEFISQKWLSAAWSEIVGAWNVDIREIQPGRAAAYVAKYLGKDVRGFKGTKRWWRSQDYEVTKEEKRLRVDYGSRTDFLEGVDFDEFKARIASSGRSEIIEEKPGWFRWRSFYFGEGYG